MCASTSLPGLTRSGPSLVLTRGSAISYLSTVTVAPITSTIRGVPSEVVLNDEDGMKAPCAVNLHNAVTISQGAIGSAGRSVRCIANGGNLRRTEVFAGV